jgi:hypothetical protein
MNLILIRESNFMLMGRNFKIYIDNTLFDKIEDGETKNIEVPENSKHLVVKIMNYKSKPLQICNENSGEYVIKQDLLSVLSTYGIILLGAVYMICKYAFDLELKAFYYLVIPLLIVDLYYMTIGRDKVIKLIRK